MKNFIALMLIVIICAILAIVAALQAQARDLGQWENSDQTIRNWYKSLMRPDAPTSSCCGEADAYWADRVVVKDGKTFAIITDDRSDEPSGRPHVPVGTEIEVPNVKLKWDMSNPTGHNIIFISRERYTFCFVQGTGI